MFRLIAGFVIAPIAPVLALAPIVAALYQSTRAVGPYLFAAAVYGYPAVTLFGIPLFLLHRRMRWNKWWQAMLAAALVGAFIPAIVIVGLGSQATGGMSHDLVTSVLAMSLVGATLGGVSGLAFWLIAIYGSNKHLIEP